MADSFLLISFRQMEIRRFFLLGMTNEGSFLSHLRIKGSRADGIYRMVMKLAILSIWLKPTLDVQRVVSNHTFLSPDPLLGRASSDFGGRNQTTVSPSPPSSINQKRYYGFGWLSLLTSNPMIIRKTSDC